MANSGEKVTFRVDMQCYYLRAEAFLVFDRRCQPTLSRHITDMLPTVGRLLAEKFNFRKRRYTTVGRQFFGGAVLHFFPPKSLQ